MSKRMERTDFSQCEESKRRKAIVEQQIDNNLPTSSVEEDLVRILYYLMALYLWFVSNSFPHFTALCRFHQQLSKFAGNQTSVFYF